MSAIKEANRQLRQGAVGLGTSPSSALGPFLPCTILGFGSITTPWVVLFVGKEGSVAKLVWEMLYLGDS